jgi:hypothetical protein
MLKLELLVGCMLLAGCASSPSAMQRHLERAATQLRHQSDADSLAAAGLFLVSKDRAQSLELLARAEGVAPTRADLVWLRLRVCQEDASCDPQSEEQRMRAVSPTNGAGWLGGLTRAFRAKDDAATDAALTAIAHSERVDLYWTTLIGHLSAAAAHTGRMSLDEAMLTVTGIVAAIAIPAYLPASNSCKGDRLERDNMRDVCRGVARALENGDTLITEMIGVAIAKRVWPEGSPEWQAAVERRRVYEYRTALWRPLEPVSWTGKQAKDYITLCLAYPREQQVMRAQLIAAGKAPDPPPS